MKSRFLILLLIAAFLPLIAFGQETESRSKKKLTITGIVTDSTRNPIAGAMILIDNKSTDIVTDYNGYYKVKTRYDAGSISVFTFANGVDEALIGGQTTINFILKGKASAQNKKPDNRKTDQTVNIGYGSVDRKDVTSQVNKLDVESTKNVSYTDIYEMIAGRIPGVQVSGKSIQIRGVSSLNLSTEPLFVVDDMVVSSIDNINPDEVKSIEVLKGSAATIYGSRGAAGVILIYLKGGSVKK